MACSIISGGTIDPDFLKKELEGDSSYKIAADRGLKALLQIGILPDEIIGDFDSADQETAEKAQKLSLEKEIPLTVLNPVKDDTDTEAALLLAFDHTEGPIRIYGGTGTRLDHVLGNLALLVKGLEEGREVFLLDPHNRIRLCDPAHPVHLRRSEARGRYLSVIPYGMKASGVTVTGVFYPLRDAGLTGDCSLGVSNEITEETASVSVREGLLFVVESRD